MACCLTAQSLYLHQCSQILSDVLCHSQTQCGLVASWIWSSLVQVIACCLTIQGHYLDRLNMDLEDLWHLHESSIMRNTRFMNHCLKTTFRSPRGQWTRQHRHIIDWCIVSVPHMWQLFVVQSDICLAPGNPVASIQKSFGSSGRDWKPWKELPIPCKFCTYRFIRYSSTCYGKVRINPLMANTRNPDFFASPVANAAWFVVVRPCYLNSDLLSGPKGN